MSEREGNTRQAGYTRPRESGACFFGTPHLTLPQSSGLQASDDDQVATPLWALLSKPPPFSFAYLLHLLLTLNCIAILLIIAPSPSTLKLIITLTVM